MCDSMHETAATPSVSLAAVKIVSLAAVVCVCVFSKTTGTWYVFRQAKVYRVLAVYDLPT